MAVNRPTMRQLSAEKKARQMIEMKTAIDEGRLVVRQMTPRERKDADAHRAAGADARAMRVRRRAATR
jgi:hypothetical protein